MVARSLVGLRGTDAQPTGVIQDRIPNNNAGLISAADVRDSMIDIADSIIPIVASGMSTATPFIQDIKLQHNPNTNQGGLLYCSGIVFDNGGTQDVAVDPDNISHSDLKDLTSDDHTQYLLANGGRQLTGDLGLKTHWINSSGALYSAISPGYRGIKFQYINNQTELVQVGSGTSINFIKDNSLMSSARGVAKAWLSFDATTNPLTVNDGYNISGIQRLSAGSFRITFSSGILKDNNYVAFGYSNALDTSNESSSYRDNTVGLVARVGDDATALRSLVFDVTDDNNDHVNAKLNGLIVFGTEPLGSGYKPQITVTES